MMELFFNELSIRVAKDEQEALGWLEKLAEVIRFIEQTTEQYRTNTLIFRRMEIFLMSELRPGKNLIDILQGHEHEPVYQYLVGKFDSPYIDRDDPTYAAYSNACLRIAGQSFQMTGLLAAHIKGGLALSLQTDSVWNCCTVTADCIKADSQQEIHICNAANIPHVRACHLGRIAGLADQRPAPCFDATKTTQTLLFLVGIYQEHPEVMGDWNIFWSELTKTPDERVAKLKVLSKVIAEVQGWKEEPNLSRKNNRPVYQTVGNSHQYLLSLDTQHGDWEVFTNTPKPLHQGSVSIDGKRFKPAEPNNHRLVV